jgi:ribosomal protein S18 acetylase RimI-like enzyme
VTDAARPLELKQLYGDPDALGQGLGARLMDWALDEARARRGRGSLTVWSENPGAQRFYARYGFVKVGEVDFMVGEQRDEDWLFALKL